MRRDGEDPEKDFSAAPIFWRYGPSPSMTRHPRWRGGAVVPVRENQRGSEKNGPRLSKGAEGKSNKEIAVERIP
jgi:hypothetical protein